LPIRLFIDQDAVLFLLKFFNIELNSQANNAANSPNQFNSFNQLNQHKPSSSALYFRKKTLTFNQLMLTFVLIRKCRN
jgi:hypothetical protein